jgi:fructosamine-3-kinase
LDNQLLHAAQRAHHWQDAYELRCQEADAMRATVEALETALREQERRAALLHGALQIALRRLEGRADE